MDLLLYTHGRDELATHRGELGTRRKNMKFQIGQTYKTRSACDHNCIISMTVIKRTAKTVTADVSGHRGIKTMRIREYEGQEVVQPWGSYSMSPVISA